MNDWIELSRSYPKRLSQPELRELVDEALTHLDPMRGKAVKLVELRDTVEEALKRIRKPGQIVGLSTGYRDVDLMTGGLDMGEVSVWYGGTSVGKSQLTQNIALNMALAGVPVLSLPLEMGMYQNTTRLLEMYGPENLERFMKLPIHYPEDKRIDIDELANTVAEGVSNFGIRAVVVDQLQQLVPRTNNNLTDSTSKTTDELHKIAEENQVHILLISHINRTGEKGSVPQLSELKGSSSIEQDADICVGLSRNVEDDEPGINFSSPLNLTLTKNRNRGLQVYRAVLRYSGLRLINDTLTLR